MKYKSYFLNYFLYILVAFVLSGCTDLRDPVPTNALSALEVHPSGWLQVNSPEFHGAFIKNIGWDLKNCQQCHGSDYAGGIANSSCLPCHPATPEDCIVCHGGVDNLTGAPPEDLAGNRNSDARGVGAHTAHLDGVNFSSGFACESCHIVPDSYYALGHVDSDLPAEVNFNNLALVDNAVPIWQAESETCQNSYCHGNWSLLKSESVNTFVYSAESMEGNSASNEWTDPTTATCGTCHDLPPKGHNQFPLDQCTVCHSAVIDINGLIINKEKHVNGNVNVFGQEYPIF